MNELDIINDSIKNHAFSELIDTSRRTHEQQITHRMH
jgi:hypothetical protein